jgi:hypothetical protein
MIYYIVNMIKISINAKIYDIYIINYIKKETSIIGKMGWAVNSIVINF